MLHKLDCYLQNVIFPIGVSTDIRLKALVRQFGLMKGNETINMCESATDFICWSIQQASIQLNSNYPVEYLLFFCMFSRLVTDLLAPIVVDDEIEQLYFRTVEVISIYEGMFPISEMKMVFHQLIDLPYFIRKFGPLRGIWAMHVERTISSLKNKGHKGGRTFYKQKRDKGYYSDDITKKLFYRCKDITFGDNHFFHMVGNECCFSDLITKVTFKQKSYEDITYLSIYEVKYYYLFLIKELQSMQHDLTTLLMNSPLYRLYYFFLKNMDVFFRYGDRRAYSGADDFSKFIIDLCENSTQIFDESSIIEDDVAKEEFCGIISRDVANEILQSDGELFYKHDIDLIPSYKAIAEKDIKISKSAFIWGTKFYARGEEYRNTEEIVYRTARYGAQGEYIPLNINEKNTLDRYHEIKQHYSSWFRSFTCEEEAINIGHINFFFVIDMKFEKYLHNLPIASVTMRESEKVTILRDMNDMNKAEMQYENLFSVKPELRDDNYIFENLYNIYPSPLAVLPVSNHRTKQQKVYKEPANQPRQKSKPSDYILFHIHRSKNCVLDNPIIRENYHVYFKNDT